LPCHTPFYSHGRNDCLRHTQFNVLWDERKAGALDCPVKRERDGDFSTVKKRIQKLEKYTRKLQEKEKRKRGGAWQLLATSLTRALNPCVLS
jgi:hypothetical protein